MSSYCFITALGTPLTEDERLLEQGLEIELARQWEAGISAVLAAGSMGVLQLLQDQTYQNLVRRVFDLSRGRGEIFVGAGDASFVRTRDRIEFLNGHKIDGVLVLPPYFFPFNQRELIDYFRSLADVSRAPLYLYDIPAWTRTKSRPSGVASSAAARCHKSL